MKLYGEQIMRRISLIIIISSLFLTGCLSHSRQGVSSNLVNYLYPDGKRPDHSSDQIPHLKLPLRVGIAFVPETRRDIEFSLTEAEKHDLLAKVAAQFKGRAYIESLDIIPELYLRQGKGFNTLSQIAALHDLDVMALVSYDQVSITEENSLSLAYWTIVGAFIVPGETTQSQTFVDTAVFDVATKKLLFRAPGANSQDSSHNALGQIKKKRRLQMKTFNVAVEQMTKNLDKELSEFRARVKEEKIATVSYKKGYSGGGSSSWFGLIFLLLLVRFSRQKNS
ncbi:rhombotarget lipoprotein [Aliikangiella coralliicola]|uniref:Rhombotarget lipoprotein n=1 Tax=Aliikangiella coralliicola TaxID=2592383 RepID=A0A545UIG8_9GAMM|nr:rhombotarget lipoprotein [Aliikangiella coralliicola]TQV89262.1 rhombotarget lipoprotein [Aliikangiella coralliicola]